MKKKFVLMIAIVLVAATACALLVGCAPKTPVDFMDKSPKYFFIIKTNYLVVTISK